MNDIDDYTIRLDNKDEVFCYLCNCDIRASNRYRSVSFFTNDRFTGTATFFVCDNCLKSLAVEAVQKKWNSIFVRREKPKEEGAE